MLFKMMNTLLSPFLVALGCLLISSTQQQVQAETIVIGDDVGWTEGVCYVPVQNAQVGDVLQFNFAGHDVQKLESKQYFDNCDFTGALLLAGVGESPYEYTITEQDGSDGTIFFSCSIGDHCSGGTQKVKVEVEPYMGQSLGGRDAPVSAVQFGQSTESCQDIQYGNTSGDSDSSNDNVGECTEPVLQEDGRYYVSCVSPAVTLTPGGVVNNLYILQYPYPTDRRVVVGLRTWEFVQDDPVNDGVIPVPINQLYVHHLSGRVVLGQGTEVSAFKDFLDEHTKRNPHILLLF